MAAVVNTVILILINISYQYQLWEAIMYFNIINDVSSVILENSVESEAKVNVF